ncbi:hypothetical protein ES708_21510 [subsurface metagenome]
MDSKNPLNLPPGSVRAIIALLLTVSIIVAMFLSVAIPKEIVGMVLAIVAFYFAHRANNTEKH